MKKIKSRLKYWLFITAILLCSSTSLAQKFVSTVQTTTLVKIGESSIIAENASFTDALEADNKMIHTASFDITLNGMDATKAILNALQSFSKDKKNLQLVFTKISADWRVLEEKLYDNTTVQEISIAALNTTSRDVIKAKIKIKAAAVELQKGDGRSDAPVGAKDRSSIAMVGNFRFTMGTLPIKRTSVISSITIRPGDNQLQNFTIELAATDGAEWNQWFLTGAGGIKKEQGSIDLLGPDLKRVLFTIQLADVEIISYSTTSSGQQISKATVGLRSKNIVFKL